MLTLLEKTFPFINAFAQICQLGGFLQAGKISEGNMEDTSVIVVSDKKGIVDTENNKKLKIEFASYIDQHMKVEKDVDPVKVQTRIECKTCGKSIVSKHFKQHQLVHSKEKKYICSKCDKGFNLPHDLKRHNRIHTGERPFECEKCKKRFRMKNYLKTQIMIHEGIKPNKCHIC